MALTKKQQRFVEEYLIDLNATQAAIRAGYKASEYTDTNANKLLENTRVRAEVDKEMARRSRRTGVSADRVLLELAKIGFANITDVVDPNTAKIKADAKEEDLACIQSIKVKPTEWGSEREVKLYDKKSALVDIGKHIGMFRDKVDISLETSDKLDDILSQMGGAGLEE